MSHENESLQSAIEAEESGEVKVQGGGFAESVITKGDWQ